MGVEYLRQLFANAGGGAGDDEDLLVAIIRYVGAELGEGETYLTSLVAEILLSEFGFGREYLADCIAHCSGLVTDAEREQ